MALAQQDLNDVYRTMKSMPVLYSWSVIQQNDHQKNKSKAMLLSGFAPGLCLAVFIVMAFTGHTDGYIHHFIMWFTLSIIVSVYAKVFMLSARCYEYYVTKRGIYSCDYQHIPAQTRAILTAVSVIGVLFCLLAANYLGHIAYVGAAAFAILVFRKKERQTGRHDHYVIYQKVMTLSNIQNAPVLMFDVAYDTSATTMAIYCHADEKPNVVKHIQATAQHCAYRECRDQADYQNKMQNPASVSSH